MASILNRIAGSGSAPIPEPKSVPVPKPPNEDNALVLDLAALSDFNADALPILSEFDEFSDESENQPVVVRQAPTAKDTYLPDLGLADLPPLPHRTGTPYENSPRLTLIKMVQECQMGEEFHVKTPPGKGRDYLQAMRQCLSRARAQSIKEKAPLTRFKLFCDMVIETEEYDELVLYRGNRGTGRKNAYSALIGKV